jgi:hypothetical protein
MGTLRGPDHASAIAMAATSFGSSTTLYPALRGAPRADPRGTRTGLPDRRHLTPSAALKRQDLDNRTGRLRDLEQAVPATRPSHPGCLARCLGTPERFGNCRGPRCALALQAGRTADSGAGHRPGVPDRRSSGSPRFLAQRRPNTVPSGLSRSMQPAAVRARSA